MPAHKDVSLKVSAAERVLFGNWSIRQVAAQFAVSKSTVHEWVKQYRESHNLGRRPGSGRRRVSTREEDAALVAEIERDPFQSSVGLIHALSPCCREGNSQCGAQETLPGICVRKYHLSRLEKFIFSDEVTFSTVNDGSHLVYCRGGQRFDPHFVASCARSRRVTVHCLGGYLFMVLVCWNVWKDA